MTGLDAPPVIPSRPPAWRTRILGSAALGATLAGFIIAAARPAWLVDPLQAAVVAAGTGGPVAFVVLCAVAAPMHLNGVLVVLSPLFWPVPLAAALSFVGSLIGCVLTAALLERAGTAQVDRDGWPPWLQRMSGEVARRPLVIGFVVRVMLNSGVALEAFYLLTGYRRGQYLLVTALGVTAWVVQALVGVSTLSALLVISPWLGLALVVAPLVILAPVAATIARRRRGSTG